MFSDNDLRATKGIVKYVVWTYIITWLRNCIASPDIVCNLFIVSYWIQMSCTALSALQTYRTEKAMTVDTLKHLHGSLKTCPQEDVIAEDPHSLKSSVKLMQHQKRALAWLIWRESHKPNGGILGKFFNTLKTHICLICTDIKVKFPSHRRTQLI